MHCGTTSDQFLRDNLDWLAKATNWAKFTATASLGVIHKVLFYINEFIKSQFFNLNIKRAMKKKLSI